jgi:hypothetical protein
VPEEAERRRQRPRDRGGGHDQHGDRGQVGRVEAEQPADPEPAQRPVLLERHRDDETADEEEQQDGVLPEVDDPEEGQVRLLAEQPRPEVEQHDDQRRVPAERVEPAEPCHGSSTRNGRRG